MFPVKLLKTVFLANDKWRQATGLTCYITNLKRVQ